MFSDPSERTWSPERNFLKDGNQFAGRIHIHEEIDILGGYFRLLEVRRTGAAVAGGRDDVAEFRHPLERGAHAPAAARGEFIFVHVFRFTGQARDAFRIGPGSIFRQRAVENLPIHRVGLIHPKGVHDAFGIHGDPRLGRDIVAVGQQERLAGDIRRSGRGRSLGFHAGGRRIGRDAGLRPSGR
jgi:hypothetical protein